MTPESAASNGAAGGLSALARNGVGYCDRPPDPDPARRLFHFLRVPPFLSSRLLWIRMRAPVLVV